MLKLRHFTAFYFLTFLLLGLIPLLSLVFNDGSMDFTAAADSASQQTGIPWTSSLINVLRLSLVEPVLLLSMLGSAVPLLAALVMLVVLRKRQHWTAFAQRLLPYRRTSVGIAAAHYGLIFALLVPCLILVLWLRNALGGEYEIEVSFSLMLIGTIVLMSLVDQGALLEELGWRGFMQPEMQKLALSPVVVAVIVGLAWGLWHLPRDITTGVIERLGVMVYLFQFLPAFVLGTISVSIIAIFFCNRLGGSVIPAIIVHGVTNDALGLSGSASITEALTPFHQITKNLPFAVIAGLMVWFSGVRLGLHSGSGQAADGGVS